MSLPNAIRLIVGVSFVLLLQLPYLCHAEQADKPQDTTAGRLPYNVYLKDDSDWWSSIGDVARRLHKFHTWNSPEKIKTQERKVSDSNFDIVGVKLKTYFTEEPLDVVAKKLGVAPIVGRGDAAIGREQACYTSINPKERIYLIFERGEMDFGAYLFSGGPKWTGSNYCVASGLISPNTGTLSGIHLGETPDQIMAILGEPSKRKKNEFIYYLHNKRKRSSQELEKLHVEYWSGKVEDRSENEFHKEFDFQESWCGIVARFANSRLNYLSLSKWDNK